MEHIDFGVRQSMGEQDTHPTMPLMSDMDTRIKRGSSALLTLNCDITNQFNG